MALDRETCVGCVEVTAKTETGSPMARNLEGVQVGRV